MNSNDWIEGINKLAPDTNHADALRGTGGRRALRNLPFSEKTFKKVAQEFYIHHSITRLVSRADVSDFSGMKLEMGQQNGQSLPANGMFVTQEIWIF